MAALAACRATAPAATPQRRLESDARRSGLSAADSCFPAAAAALRRRPAKFAAAWRLAAHRRPRPPMMDSILDDLGSNVDAAAESSTDLAVSAPGCCWVLLAWCAGLYPACKPSQLLIRCPSNAELCMPTYNLVSMLAALGIPGRPCACYHAVACATGVCPSLLAPPCRAAGSRASCRLPAAAQRGWSERPSERGQVGAAIKQPIPPIPPIQCTIGQLIPHPPSRGELSLHHFHGLLPPRRAAASTGGQCLTSTNGASIVQLIATCGTCRA